MTHEDFARFLAKLQHAERQVREDGQKEYARQESNAFANFERVAAWMDGVSREQVLMVYALKHLDGIMSHLGGHESQREDVSGRIKDARMYLALLWGMLAEDGSAEAPTNGVEIGKAHEW